MNYKQSSYLAAFRIGTCKSRLVIHFTFTRRAFWGAETFELFFRTSSITAAYVARSCAPSFSCHTQTSCIGTGSFLCFLLLDPILHQTRLEGLSIKMEVGLQVVRECLAVCLGICVVYLMEILYMVQGYTYSTRRESRGRRPVSDS